MNNHRKPEENAVEMFFIRLFFMPKNKYYIRRNNMNRVFELNDLTESIECLFLSGADGEHDEDEMLDLLDGIDWKALYQALLLQGRRVYEFIAGGEASSRMNYRSRDLFGQRAVCLDEDIQFPQNTAEDNQVNTYSYELWLLEDFSLVVTSCYRMKIGGGTYRSEYRTIKSYDWQDTEMDINFCCVADALENLCNLVKNHGYPLIEV